MDELNISVLVNRDLEIVDGGLLLRDTAAAGDGRPTALLDLSIETVALSPN